MLIGIFWASSLDKIAGSMYFFYLDFVFIIFLKNLYRLIIGIYDLKELINEDHADFAGACHMAEHFAFQITVNIIRMKGRVGLHHRMDMAEQVAVDNTDVQVQHLHQFKHGIKADLPIADIDDFFDLYGNQMRFSRRDSDFDFVVDAGVL